MIFQSPALIGLMMKELNKTYYTDQSALYALKKTTKFVHDDEIWLLCSLSHLTDLFCFEVEVEVKTSPYTIIFLILLQPLASGESSKNTWT